MTSTAVETAEARLSIWSRERIDTTIGVMVCSGLLLWIVINVIATPGRFVDLIFVGFQVGSLYALIALGYTLIYGIIGLINFAHGDLFMLASIFTSVLLEQYLGVQGPSLTGFALTAVVLIVVMLGCSAINVTADRLVFRRLRGGPRLASLIAAVGLSFMFQWLGLQINGSGQRIWPTVIPNGGIALGSLTIAYSTIVVTGITIPLLMLLTWFVTKTRHGQAMRATSQDMGAAELMGINVNRTIGITFAIGGALAGAAGLLYFATFGNTNYLDGYQFGLIAFTAAVLGGVGNLPGAVLGGFLIGILQSFNDGFTYAIGQQWSQSVVFSVLILVLVFRPQGLLGERPEERT